MRNAFLLLFASCFLSISAHALVLGEIRGRLTFQLEQQYPAAELRKISGNCQGAYNIRVDSESLHIDYGLLTCERTYPIQELSRNYQIKNGEIFDSERKVGSVLSDGTYRLDIDLFKKEVRTFRRCYGGSEDLEYEVPGRIMLELQPLAGGSWRYLRMVDRAFLSPVKGTYYPCDSLEDKRAVYQLGRHQFSAAGVLNPYSP